MDNLRFEEMTISEIKDWFSVVACQNYSQVRDYIFLNFMSSKEAVKKSKLAERIFNRYNKTFNPETIASVIKTYIEMGILQDLGDGIVRISMQEDWNKRDEEILQSRGQVLEMA